MSDEVTRFLGELDISDLLEHDRSIRDIMNDVDAIYGDMYTGDGWIFQDVSEEDFADYIRQEYGIKSYVVEMLFLK